MEWSTDLQAKLDNLTPAQRRAIVRIVTGEVEGISLNRMLKTSYSCRWCGHVAEGETGSEREALLADHEKACGETLRPWVFACHSSTYYGKWRHDPGFTGALDQAREELTNNVVSEAARLLQLSTSQAVRVLMQVMASADFDSDRRLAAVAILDRADLKTSTKAQANQQVVDLLQELRSA